MNATTITPDVAEKVVFNNKLKQAKSANPDNINFIQKKLIGQDTLFFNNSFKKEATITTKTNIQNIKPLNSNNSEDLLKVNEKPATKNDKKIKNKKANMFDHLFDLHKFRIF